MSDVFYREVVESQCPVTHRQVQLTLLSKAEPKGVLIVGKPVECNHYKATCYNSSARCLLKSPRIETRRKSVK
jgi:hypothetical protein